MENEGLMNIPVRGTCRVCGAPTLAALTVCPDCGAKVQDRMGGVDDWQVREYMRLMRLIEDAPAPPYYPQPKPLPSTLKNVPCVCGRLYSRQIAVDACAARDHQPAKESNYA